MISNDLIESDLQFFVKLSPEKNITEERELIMGAYAERS